MDGVRVFELLIAMITCILLLNPVFLGHALNPEGKSLLRFKERVNKDPFRALDNWEDSSLQTHHCSWFGVRCVDGHVVSLTLKDLCLEGTLAPELGHLVHIKLIILRNNSFSGPVLEEIFALKELQVLDLGYNKLSGPLPLDFRSNVFILLLDHNGEFCQVEENHPTMEGSKHGLKLKASCVAFEHVKMSSEAMMSQESPAHHRDLREISKIPDLFPRSPEATESPPPPSLPPPTPTPAPSSTTDGPTILSPSVNIGNLDIIIISASVGAFIVICFIVRLLIWRSKNMATVGTWRTGLSGPLQRSLVTGLPKLKRLELEIACEEFSNVIGTTSTGTLYKGTLSSGAEIAVLAHAVKASKDWSSNLDSEFRKKVNTLSELNHKNFLNLIGYCEEERPFARMLVFEYAPNGTLFEHLHVRESEHLDWAMRLRVIMGIAYCLEHMHSLTPQVIHENLTTNTINLTEDYASKISDFPIWNEVSFASRPQPVLIDSMSSPETNPEHNVYSFGLILLEIVTGKPPFSWSTGLLNEWASDYLSSKNPRFPLRDLADPVLMHFDVDQLETLGAVIRSCTCSNPQERPRMSEVAQTIRDVTGVTIDGAAPRVSPMWWAELELMSPQPENQAAFSRNL